MKLFLACFVVLMGSSAFANRESGGLGPVATYASCSGALEDGTAVTFEVRSTAIPNWIDSVLVNTATKEVMAQLSCHEGTAVAAGAPSAGKTEWICEEYQQVDDGDISVELLRGGPTGVLTGEIKQKQMFPLEPKVIGALLCQ